MLIPPNKQYPPQLETLGMAEEVNHEPWLSFQVLC